MEICVKYYLTHMLHYLTHISNEYYVGISYYNNINNDIYLILPSQYIIHNIKMNMLGLFILILLKWKFPIDANFHAKFFFKF